MKKKLLLFITPLLLFGFGCKKDTPQSSVQAPLQQETAQTQLSEEERLDQQVEIVVGTQHPGETNLVFERVHTPKDGWLVVYNTMNGQPSIFPSAHVPIQKGTHTDVHVPLSSPTKSKDMYVTIIHLDDGTLGTFAFPQEDPPLPMKAVMVKVE